MYRDAVGADDKAMSFDRLLRLVGWHVRCAPREVMQMCEMLWDFAVELEDAKAGDSVTLASFVRALGLVTTSHTDMRLSVLFRLFDVSGDGQINMDEARTMMETGLIEDMDANEIERALRRVYRTEAHRMDGLPVSSFVAEFRPLGLASQSFFCKSLRRAMLAVACGQKAWSADSNALPPTGVESPSPLTAADRDRCTALARSCGDKEVRRVNTRKALIRRYASALPRTVEQVLPHLWMVACEVEITASGMSEADGTGRKARRLPGAPKPQDRRLKVPSVTADLARLRIRGGVGYHLHKLITDITAMIRLKRRLTQLKARGSEDESIMAEVEELVQPVPGDTEAADGDSRVQQMKPVAKLEKPLETDISSAPVGEVLAMALRESDPMDRVKLLYASAPASVRITPQEQRRRLRAQAQAQAQAQGRRNSVRRRSSVHQAIPLAKSSTVAGHDGRGPTRPGSRESDTSSAITRGPPSTAAHQNGGMGNALLPLTALADVRAHHRANRRRSNPLEFGAGTAAREDGDDGLGGGAGMKAGDEGGTGHNAAKSRRAAQRGRPHNSSATLAAGDSGLFTRSQRRQARKAQAAKTSKAARKQSGSTILPPPRGGVALRTSPGGRSRATRGAQDNPPSPRAQDPAPLRRGPEKAVQSQNCSTPVATFAIKRKGGALGGVDLDSTSVAAPNGTKQDHSPARGPLPSGCDARETNKESNCDSDSDSDSTSTGTSTHTSTSTSTSASNSAGEGSGRGRSVRTETGASPEGWERETLPAQQVSPIAAASRTEAAEETDSAELRAEDESLVRMLLRAVSLHKVEEVAAVAERAEARVGQAGCSRHTRLRLEHAIKTSLFLCRLAHVGATMRAGTRTSPLARYLGTGLPFDMQPKLALEHVWQRTILATYRSAFRRVLQREETELVVEALWWLLLARYFSPLATACLVEHLGDVVRDGYLALTYHELAPGLGDAAQRAATRVREGLRSSPGQQDSPSDEGDGSRQECTSGQDQGRWIDAEVFALRVGARRADELRRALPLALAAGIFDSMAVAFPGSGHRFVPQLLRRMLFDVYELLTGITLCNSTLEHVENNMFRILGRDERVSEEGVAEQAPSPQNARVESSGSEESDALQQLVAVREQRAQQRPDTGDWRMQRALRRLQDNMLCSDAVGLHTFRPSPLVSRQMESAGTGAPPLFSLHTVSARTFNLPGGRLRFEQLSELAIEREAQASTAKRGSVSSRAEPAPGAGAGPRGRRRAITIHAAGASSASMSAIRMGPAATFATLLRLLDRVAPSPSGRSPQRGAVGAENLALLGADREMRLCWKLMPYVMREVAGPRLRALPGGSVLKGQGDASDTDPAEQEVPRILHLLAHAETRLYHRFRAAQRQQGDEGPRRPSAAPRAPRGPRGPRSPRSPRSPRHPSAQLSPRGSRDVMRRTISTMLPSLINPSQQGLDT